MQILFFNCFLCCRKNSVLDWCYSVWTVRWDLVCTVVLIGRFAWFDESLESWNFDRIKTKSLTLVWCLFESYFIKEIKHIFLWVYHDNKPLGMFGSGVGYFSFILPAFCVVYYAGKPIKKYVLLLLHKLLLTVIWYQCYGYCKILVIIMYIVISLSGQLTKIRSIFLSDPDSSSHWGPCKGRFISFWWACIQGGSPGGTCSVDWSHCITVLTWAWSHCYSGWGRPSQVKFTVNTNIKVDFVARKK